ncbi:heme-binding domain-containing protein [Telluribacter sp. SYSU D00476]|uniref:heme-binding domain-containing protein n=1 Tax=Telluribacter sp. SYSU D00476 TaxID=2811430 RepID=UPI001FF45FFA|nr:heme-binding domain-containing protein [Telluribacter sp. SYSU D00476]
MIGKIFLGVIVLLVIIQLIRPTPNSSNDRTYDIATRYDVPQDVQHILSIACNDCHSNQTIYPWYSNVQPVAWWLDHHIQEGKEHLNFSAFTNAPLARQYHKLEEIVEVVEESEMPMKEYTYLGMHPEANLTEAQKQRLIQWARAQMDTLKANYPADSLVRKRRG